MITMNRVVLVANAKIFNEVNFEAIERVDDLCNVEEVWKNNKTPMIFRGNMEYYKGTNYPILDVPDELREDHLDEDFEKFCHSRLIECGEVVHPQTFKDDNSDCFLCQEGMLQVDGHVCDSVAEFNRKVEKVSDVIVYRSEHFFVKVELGCFVEGMLMINPHEHIYSQAMMQDEYLDEYQEVMDHVEALLKAAYGQDKPVIYFEHGSAPTGFSSHASSIVHAHTHVAIGYEFDEKYKEMVKLRPIGDIRELRKSKYMSYQVGSRGQLMAVNDKKVYVQRQFPRQVLALMAGVSNWNWRFDPCEKEMANTFDTLLKTLTEKADELDPVILERCEGFIKGFPQRM